MAAELLQVPRNETLVSQAPRRYLGLMKEDASAANVALRNLKLHEFRRATMRQTAQVLRTKSAMYHQRFLEEPKKTDTSLTAEVNQHT